MAADAAVALLVAFVFGQPWPPGVADTPRRRQLAAATAADVEALLARGWLPDVPAS